MANAAQVDDHWEAALMDPGAAPHLESNKWLADVICTAPERRPQPEPVSIPFLGQTILWTMDRDRPFPEWVASSLARLLMFSELEEGWDSYGGRPLQATAVGSILRLLVRIHQMGRTADLLPLPDGGVGIRIEEQVGRLEIDVAGDGTVEALLERVGLDDISIGPDASIAEAEQALDQFVA